MVIWWLSGSKYICWCTLCRVSTPKSLHNTPLPSFRPLLLLARIVEMATAALPGTMAHKRVYKLDGDEMAPEDFDILKWRSEDIVPIKF